jgi:cyclopropane-fatty-acyl-phospholipid synthase
VNHYIFPGGYLPSTTLLLNHINKASNGTLIVEQIENIGGHYSKTLRLWRESFLDSFDEKVRPALKKEHPGMTQQEIDVFKRKWEVRKTFLYSRPPQPPKSIRDSYLRPGLTEYYIPVLFHLL